MDNVTTIEINGITYYVSSDDIDYLFIVGNNIINTKSSTVTLYGSFREYNNNSSGYPRITIQSFGKGYITQSYQSQPSTLNVNSYEIKSRYINSSYLLLVLIFSIMVLIFFKKR